MPQPVETLQPQPSPEDSFLELLRETLASLDESVRGQFLQRFFKTIAQVELTERESLEYWEKILARKQELSESLRRPVTLKTAMVDVLASINFLRLPILMEYDELKKLQFNAATDPLTGLHNRRLFEEYFNKELNRAQRYGHPLALLMLDLHDFKAVNDRYGHQQGDLMLQMVASTLRKTLRASDFAFRIGGDEFAVLLPQSDSEQATTLARRLRTQFEIEVQSFKLEIGAALDYGVAVSPQDGEQREQLIRVADERLYQWKSTVRPSPRAAPVETVPPRPVEPAPPPGPRPVPPMPGPAPAPPRAVERRKWERVSLAGTHAYAVLGEGKDKTAQVMDLSYGGVALAVERPEELPSLFTAVLHVPILPPVRVSLRRVYVLRREGGPARVGCAFVS